MPIKGTFPAAFTTADAYATVTGAELDTWETDTPGFSVVAKAATNGATFKVQVSNNGTDYADHPEAALVDVAVAAGATKAVKEAAGCAFRHYRIQARSTTAGSASTFTVAGMVTT